MSFPAKSTLRIGLMASVTASALLIAAPFGGGRSENARAPTAVPVSVAVVERHDTLTWLGTNSPAALKRLSASTFALAWPAPIRQIHFREGALVKAGDLLVTIDPAPYAAEVDRLEALVAAANRKSSSPRPTSSERAK